MKHVFGALCVFLLIPAAIAAASAWERHVDPVYGTAALYPAHVFAPAPGETGVPGQAFLSADGRAKLAIAAWDNADEDTAGTFKDRLLRDNAYPVLTYEPRGRSWFVLSGYRGDKIYYEKVMFSCDRQVVNAFAITYPAAERAIYDPIVERMEDHFRPGRRCR